MRKRIIALAAIAICLSIITQGTAAYFTASDVTRNVITSGGIDVRVVEEQTVDGELKPYPVESIRIMPGAVVSKIVSVQSVEQEAWVRMNYQVTVYNSRGEELEKTAEELEQVILIDPDREAWSWSDGWWYYNSAVNTGEKTVPLFETVTFSGTDMGNEYQNCTVEINVTAQAVQKANNGDSVMEALGWPEE